MVACIQYQNVYEQTTAVEHLLTLNNFREDPALFNTLYFEEFLKVRAWLGLDCMAAWHLLHCMAWVGLHGTGWIAWRGVAWHGLDCMA